MSTRSLSSVISTDLTVLLTPSRTSARSRAAGLVAALLTGALVALALPEHEFGFVAWLALVPLLVASERTARIRDACWLGWLAGTTTNLIGLFWMVDLLQRFGPLTLPWAIAGYVGLCLYQGLVFALFAVVTQLLRRRLRIRGRSLPLALLAPLVMVACELPLPCVFPWNLAMTQAWSAPVIQLAELGGAFAVTALLVLLNGALADAWLARGREFGPLLGASLLLALALGFGQWRIAQLHTQEANATKLKVGVVQGNLAASAEVPDLDTLRARLTSLQDVSKQLEARGAELIVWTETAYPYALAGTMRRDYPRNYLTRIRRDFTAPLVFGAAVVDSLTNGQPHQTNSALLLDRDEALAGRYDKNELVTFGERAPLEDRHPWFQRLRLGSAGEFSPGSKVASFSFAHAGRHVTIAPLICLEDILAHMGLRVGALHPELLVNLTNDAWFGPTSEPVQHLALAVFRSVELRVPMVRAVNTGPSAFISATGEVRGRTQSASSLAEARAPEAVLGEVALLEGGHTFFAQYGNAFAQLCTLLVLLGMLGTKRRAGEPSP